MTSVNLYEAKTTLSSLVERAAGGEASLEPRKFGQNEMGITYIAPDFDEPAYTDEELDEMGL